MLEKEEISLVSYVKGYELIKSQVLLQSYECWAGEEEEKLESLWVHSMFTSY